MLSHNPKNRDFRHISGSTDRKKFSGRNGYDHNLDMTNTHLWAENRKNLMIKS